MIEAVFALLLGIVIGLAYRPCRHALHEHFTVVSLEIVGANMPDIAEGAVDHLQILARNKALRVLSFPSNVKLAETGPDGAAVEAPAVAADGTFDFAAGAVDGAFSFVASDGTNTSNTYVETVVPDNAVASLEIAPVVAA